jgi:uncharacterized SAM-binding protein YcdF (DUF218 family)
MVIERNKNPKFRYAAVLLVVGAVLLAARVPVLRQMGSVLVIEDSLQPSAAIVALAGQTPFREMEAAKLFRAGWAPKVVLVRGGQSEEEKALNALGITIDQGWTISREVLIRLGVPAPAILVLDAKGEGTLGELQTVRRGLDVKDDPVILVTSKYHGLRTSLTWSYVTEGHSRGIVRSATRDPFDPMRWWRERPFVLAVVREYLGLVNYYTGFPVGRASN